MGIQVDPASTTLFVATALGLLFLTSFSRRRTEQSQDVIRQWAQANGFKNLRAERRIIFHGPFFDKAARGQLVFRITACDRNGQSRTGWILYGEPLAGLARRNADVVWEVLWSRKGDEV